MIAAPRFLGRAMPKTTFAFALATVLTIMAASARANCDALAQPANENYPGLIATKPLPANPGKQIVAIARFARDFGSPPSPPDGLYDLEVLIANEDCSRIHQRHYQKEALASDAERLSGLWIDTAPYQLSKNLRAFGVRVSNTHYGGTNSERIELRLFAIVNGELRPLMEPLVTAFSINERGLAECPAFSRSENRIVAIGKKSHNQLADLVVTETQEESEPDAEDKICNHTTRKSTSKSTLIFDGKTYRPAAKASSSR